MSKTGRNDPCPCGSGKKYKNCCLAKEKTPLGKRKFSAKLISQPKSIDLMERTYGAMQAKNAPQAPEEAPPTPEQTNS